MDTERRSAIEDVRRLIHEHLVAAMIMVPLDDPLDPEMSIEEVIRYLDQNEFDVALLATDDVRVIYRDRLKQLPETGRNDPVKRRWASPRIDRLIGHSLELGEVARRLGEDEVPLLVVGRDGPEYIVTRADFTRPAGVAGVLAIIVLLDAQLDELLRAFESEAWNHVDEERRDELSGLLERARQQDEEVIWTSYLTLRERFDLIRMLELSPRLSIDLGTQEEHELITSVRNDIAHGRPVRSGAVAIESLTVSERILDAIGRASVGD